MELRKISVVARREYAAMVRTKSFLISILLVPVMMVGSALVQQALADRGSTEDKTLVIFDHSGVLAQDLQAAALARNTAATNENADRARFILEFDDAKTLDDERRLALSKMIREGEITAFVEFGAAVVDGKSSDPGDTKIAYFAESLAFSDLRRWFESSSQKIIIRRRLLAAGLDDQTIASSLAPVPFDAGGPLERDADGTIKTTDKTATIVAEIAPFGLMILIFFSVMMAAQPALQAVIEEKQQRIAEVLLGSLHSADLMFGKLLGYVGVSLTLVSVYLGLALIAAHHYGFLSILPPTLIAWVLSFVALAVLLYGAVFLAVGAAVSDIKESQNLIMPIMMVLIAPLMVWPQVIAEPLGSFATILSLVPPMTPMLMPMRIAVSEAVPLWQPLLGFALTLLTALIVVIAAGRIFRIGILIHGKPPKLSELARWALRGE
ncbi:MAG TPA: ABC transporter permease [Nannocystis exedens]|nr:ABC transporter permease [Nannocystis exedens]